jgi:hypothetical protein
MDSYIYINLISKQLIPNVIPTLSNKENIKKIYLVLAGSTYEDKAKLLEKYYKNKGLQDIEIFHCLDPNDYYSVRSKAKGLFKYIKTSHPDDSIVLNATGGTKPMSLAFTQEFDKLREKSMAIYMDTDNKKITILSDLDGLPNLPYKSVLDIEDYLRLNGFAADSWVDNFSKDHAPILSRFNLSQTLINAANRPDQPISALNKICQKTNFNQNGKKFLPEVEIGFKPSAKLVQVLLMAAEHGMIKWQDQTVFFDSEDAASYLGGGWFEELIYLAAHEVGIEHIALSLEGHQINNRNASEEDNVKNELDVVLVNNNQMMIIEAKTVNWKSPGSGQNVTLKLDSLTADLGGPFAKGLLASALEFKDSTRDRLNTKSNLIPYRVTSYQLLITYLKEWKVKTD